MKNATLALALLLAILASPIFAGAQNVATVTTSISATVQTACATSSSTGAWQVLIPSGATPTDTIASARGCTRVFITDQRQTPPVTCQWISPSYLCSGPKPTPGPTPTPTPGTNPLLPALADYLFRDGSGATLTDSSGNGNNATLGTTPPTWETADLAFDLNQYVSLPAALNTAKSFVVALYIASIQGGPFGAENNIAIPVLLGNTANDAGLSLMVAAPRPAGDDYMRYAFAPSVFAGGGESTATGELIAGFHTLAYTLGTSGTSVDHLYIDGREFPYYMAQGANAGKQTTGNLTIGAAPGTSVWRNTFKGAIYRLRAYAGQLTQAQVTSENMAITAEVAARGVAVTPSPVPSNFPTLHCVGDSITYGIGTTVPYCNNLTLDTPFAQTLNWGIPGMYIQSIAGSETNRVARYCASATAGPSVVTVFAATNDFAEVSANAARIFQAAAAEVAILKRAGCSKVFLGTMLSRGGNDGAGNTLDSDKDAYDAILLAKARSVGADGVVDFAADPRLGADGANSNTTYFNGDLTHPTNAGQAILAAEDSNTLNFYLSNYSTANPRIVTAATYAMASGDSALLLQPSASQALTLPSCLGPSGAEYRFLNNQSVYTVTVTGQTAAQLVNGSASPFTLAGGATSTLRILPNPKNVGGCQWIADGSGGTSTPTAATPTISPAAGTYSAAQTITLASGTSGASIFYTLDGSTPTSGSTAYSAPFSLSSGATVKAIATKSGLSNSGVLAATYVINTPPATYAAANGCANSGGAGVGTIGCAAPSVTAGQTLFVNVVNYAAGAVSLADSTGNTATLLPGYPVSINGQGTNAVYVIKNASAGTHTITATLASGNYPQIMVDAVSGASATSPVDAASNLVQATTGGVYDYSCTAVTTNAANELVLSFINTTAGAATGYETTPQQLSAAQSAANSSNISAYGTFTTAGSNYVRWQVAAGSFSCDTVAIH